MGVWQESHQREKPEMTAKTYTSVHHIYEVQIGPSKQVEGDTACEAHSTQVVKLMDKNGDAVFDLTVFGPPEGISLKVVKD